jgi:F420-dependent oxidoreductase-like protein
MELDLMIEGQEGVSWEQWVAIAQSCEAAGIPALFRSDHYQNLDGEHPERAALDAWGVLCGLAAVTTTLRLGTLVSPATFRHPSELARLVVTADHISGGRVELGLGAGWNEREHAANGFPFPDLRTRMDVLEEQLEIVLGHWRDEVFSYAGAHYRLEQLDAHPKPVQRPHPPVLLGGTAGPRGCALAARFADEYNTVFATPAELRERRARVLAACAQAGRPPISVSVMTAVIAGRDAGEVRDGVARVAAVRDATPDQIRAKPGWIIGTVDQVTERLVELRDAGASRVICQHNAHDAPDMIELLGRELAPRLAEKT